MTRIHFENLSSEITKAAVEIKSLNSEVGINFLHETWAHSIKGSREYIQRVVRLNASAGVFIDDKPISGILTTGNGFMGMLFTLKEFRNKNYGRLCMTYLIRQLGVQDFIPCSVVEERNRASVGFHERVGMRKSHVVDFVCYNGSNF